MTAASQLRATFHGHFGASPEHVVRSPGRVNLIGEHTDYNDGWVVPAALDLGTTVAVSHRADGVLRTVAPRMAGEDEARLDSLLRPGDGPPWARYVRGVAALLQSAGHRIAGANLLIDGDLPLGSGLSSSASVELGVATALLALSGVRFDQRALARLGQRVENEIIGVHSGIMDQLAIACGVAGHALLIDCRLLTVQPVPLPPGVRLLVLDSAVPRTLAGSAYNQRRAECEAALGKLREVEPRLKALRDVSHELLERESHRLQPVELRRARHVVSENQRVLASVAALQRGDLREFGRLMVASHVSLRDDYAVSGPELDALVDIALETEGVLGARLTGAGFGGCAIALVEARHAAGAGERIMARYRSALGNDGRAYITTPSAGTSIVETVTA